MFISNDENVSGTCKYLTECRVLWHLFVNSAGQIQGQFQHIWFHDAKVIISLCVLVISNVRQPDLELIYCIAQAN